MYLNTAAFGLVAPQVKAFADAFYTDLAQQGSSVAEHWRDVLQPGIRNRLAGFLGAAPEQVAMIPNFSWALNALVHGLDGGERMLLYRGEYPSVTEPFVLNGFAVEWIDDEAGFALPMERMLETIRAGKVDIVALSHVQYNSGYVADLRQLGDCCREHGVWFIVDATQSLGALPIDVSALPVDVLISSHYKWMNAGFGTGSMYCSAAFMKRYPPKTGGSNSYLKPGQDWLESDPMRAFEPGHANMYGLTLLDAAIADRLQPGVETIAAGNAALTAALLEGIRDSGLPLIGPATMANRCSILVFHDEHGLSERLRAAGITATFRGGRVRISFHHHNTVADVEALLRTLSA